jgi:hypothetical protein
MTSLSIIYFTIVIALNQVTDATTIETKSARIKYNDFDQRIIEKFFDVEYNEDEHDEKRVFYSHSMMMYGTDNEKTEKELIKNKFSYFGLVIPKFYEDNGKKMTGDFNKLYKNKDGKMIKEMKFYKTVVGSCDILVYSEWEGQIPSGVAIEVNHAIDMGKPVFQLDGDKFVPQKGHVHGLSYEETVKMYNEN